MKSNLRIATALGIATILLAAMGVATSVALGKGGPFATSSDTTSTTTSTAGAPTTTTATGQSSKVLVCHRTHSKKKPFHTIRVAPAAVPAHLAHGDSLGACGTGPSSPTTTGNTHGQGHGNSK